MGGQCSITSATLRGVEAIPVVVEVAVSGGLPGISIVGMADTAVQEARERVRAAIRSSGFAMPNDKIVVNLAPGNVRKTGSGFDLPIAVGILVATGQVDPKIVEGCLVVGELSLEGQVRPVSGMLAFGICARNLGCPLIGAADGECVSIRDVDQRFLRHLGRLHTPECFEHASNEARKGEGLQVTDAPDFKDVAGHEVAKRALQIAAAGRHGLLMVGPPGSGKTMLASRIGSILPPLSQDEMLEAAVVHSVAGESIESVMAGIRPFRSPHHSATPAGLVGGGNPIRPGEISLAHRGVLFLDELAEFRASTLQSLRQPMESGRVCLTRADGNVVFPARFMLVAATNPCPCGYYGDDEHACTCTLPQVRQYQGRIGGPLMDRIDLQLDVRRLDPRSVLETGNGTDSHTLREGVMAAREFKAWRMRSAEGDADKRTSADIVHACRLTDEVDAFVVSMAQAYAMSARALVNVLSVARTIADLEQSEAVSADHIAEALGFRLREGLGGA